VVTPAQGAGVDPSVDLGNNPFSTPVPRRRAQRRCPTVPPSCPPQRQHHLQNRSTSDQVVAGSFVTLTSAEVTTEGTNATLTDQDSLPGQEGDQNRDGGAKETQPDGGARNTSRVGGAKVNRRNGGPRKKRQADGAKENRANNRDRKKNQAGSARKERREGGAQQGRTTTPVGGAWDTNSHRDCRTPDTEAAAVTPATATGDRSTQDRPDGGATTQPKSPDGNDDSDARAGTPAPRRLAHSNPAIAVVTPAPTTGGAFLPVIPRCRRQRRPDPNPLTTRSRTRNLADSVMAAVTTDSATIRTAFVHDPLLPRPSSTNLQPHIGALLHQICVWGSNCTTTVMWLRLDMVCRAAALAKGVVKVDRVEQQNTSVRFDVYVLTAVAAFWRRRMRKFAPRWHWHFRSHVPFELRDRVQNPPTVITEDATPPAAPVDRAPLRPGTLNVNGVRTKQTDLWHLLCSERLNILALQETLLKATDWDLHVPDYLCLSALRTTAASQWGVSLLVHTKFGCQPVGPGSPNWVFGKLTGTTLARHWRAPSSSAASTSRTTTSNSGSGPSSPRHSSKSTRSSRIAPSC
jgi:hypothetical protein